jgi:transglutaminase-like putative cysteine protease
MAEFDIQYQSHNSYNETVKEAIFEFCIVPCNDVTQILIDFKTSNSLVESSFSYKNVFGFEINRIRTSKPFTKFNFTLNARVDKKYFELPQYAFLSLQEEAELLASNDFFIEHHLFLNKTFYTTISGDSLPKILKFKNDQPVLEFLKELNNHVYSQLEYKKNITDVKTTADQILKIKAGVCQDFTHLFIAISRYNGIPARYTSGYLNQGKKFIGAMFMHAWVEAFVPGIGWVGFDPTNNQLADMNYIKVAHGIDYNDCSSIKGVLKTTGENETIYEVKVVEQ